MPQLNYSFLETGSSNWWLTVYGQVSDPLQSQCERTVNFRCSNMIYWDTGLAWQALVAVIKQPAELMVGCRLNGRDQSGIWSPRNGAHLSHAAHILTISTKQVPAFLPRYEHIWTGNCIGNFHIRTKTKGRRKPEIRESPLIVLKLNCWLIHKLCQYLLCVWSRTAIVTLVCSRHYLSKPAICQQALAWIFHTLVVYECVCSLLIVNGWEESRVGTMSN